MTTATKEYSTDDVLMHKTRDDLWLVIDGKGKFFAVEQIPYPDGAPKQEKKTNLQ